MGGRRKISVHDPVVWFIAYLVVAALSGLAFYRNLDMNQDLVLWLQGVTLSYMAAVWVHRDAIRRKSYFPSDLIFIYGQAMFPAYMILERRWKGLLWLFVVLALLVMTVLLPEIFV